MRQGLRRADQDEKVIVADSPTISLALGGGGARGLAHIGVIQWLTENGYDIRSIAGSSMGALVGGIYATGKLGLYAEWVLALERIRVVRLFDLAFGRAGLFKGDRIMGALRGLIGEFAIEDLPVSFTAVATDLESGEEVWLREGKLFDAIRASIATPLIFTPFEYRGRKLLDGSLVNPVPIEPTLNDTTKLTVAVNLSGPIEFTPSLLPSAPVPDGNAYRLRIRAFIESLHLSRARAAPERGIFDIAFASMEAMHNTIARLKLAAYSPDVTVEIPRNACGFFEFWRAKELIALGRERTAQAFAAIGH
ncbi:MAG TPA: patatin-like phospholipase family protein [Burkholderiales bacterium]|nr:patatin-like phospholipase family protein [Burkholderiales bacterium]